MKLNRNLQWGRGGGRGFKLKNLSLKEKRDSEYFLEQINRPAIQGFTPIQLL